jgi:hypothetical protein
MTVLTKDTAKPWYREPWPWLLMSGPVIVIIAALTSAWIAVRTSDGLVSDDYYKQGLAAGETLAKSRHAADLGITANVRLRENSVSIRLTGKLSEATMPNSLNVTLSHPTRAGLDQHSVLQRSAAQYVGDLRLPASGHWLIVIEDDKKTWRLMGSLMLPATEEAVIGGSSFTSPES